MKNISPLIITLCDVFKCVSLLMKDHVLMILKCRLCYLISEGHVTL